MIKFGYNLGSLLIGLTYTQCDNAEKAIQSFLTGKHDTTSRSNVESIIPFPKLIQISDYYYGRNPRTAVTMNCNIIINYKVLITTFLYVYENIHDKEGYKF
jgi:hypothetical protein